MRPATCECPMTMGSEGACNGSSRTVPHRVRAEWPYTEGEYAIRLAPQPLSSQMAGHGGGAGQRPFPHESMVRRMSTREA